jgi:hypothetical protein
MRREKKSAELSVASLACTRWPDTDGRLDHIMDPHPILVKGNRESERPYRNVDCDHYGNCLDVALGSRWSDFSCSECAAYTRTRFIEQATGSDDYW